MAAYFRRVLLAVLLCAFAWGAGGAPRAEHVFIISLDGGKPAVIQQSPMPVLSQWVAEGAHTWTALTIVPSQTLPAHASMLTGVEPAKHKILWNNYAPAAGVVRVTTVFAAAKQAGFSTAMFVGKEKFLHLVQPETVDRFDYNRRASGEVAKMENGKKVTKEGTVPAAVVARDASLYILENKPNLCFIHLADPDTAGHKHGWGSPEQIKAFAASDAALGVIQRAIQDAGIAGQSVVLVSADHGGHAKTHGTKSPEDRQIPWIAFGRGVKPGFTVTVPVNTCDTAATALWLLGIPLPPGLDGRPVTSAFN